MARVTNGHIHKYKRYRTKSGAQWFFCATEHCTHQTPVERTLGKTAECWSCGKPFIMTPYAYRLSKPHCPKCHKPKNKQQEEENIVIKMPIGSLKERMDRLIGVSDTQDEDL